MGSPLGHFHTPQRNVAHLTTHGDRHVFVVDLRQIDEHGLACGAESLPTRTLGDFRQHVRCGDVSAVALDQFCLGILTSAVTARAHDAHRRWLSGPVGVGQPWQAASLRQLCPAPCPCSATCTRRIAHIDTAGDCCAAGFRLMSAQGSCVTSIAGPNGAAQLYER
jgi:hypothetical protein